MGNKRSKQKKGASRFIGTSGSLSDRMLRHSDTSGLAIFVKFALSYGAMRVTMSFLTKYEQLGTQQLCIWYYKFGTGRV